jgi:hypothetical protein
LETKNRAQAKFGRTELIQAILQDFGRTELIQAI